MSYNKKIGALGAIVGILSGCGSVDTYKETTSHDEKPIYCYQSIIFTVLQVLLSCDQELL